MKDGERTVGDGEIVRVKVYSTSSGLVAVQCQTANVFTILPLWAANATSRRELQCILCRTTPVLHFDVNWMTPRYILIKGTNYLPFPDCQRHQFD